MYKDMIGSEVDNFNFRLDTESIFDLEMVAFHFGMRKIYLCINKIICAWRIFIGENIFLSLYFYYIKSDFDYKITEKNLY